MTRAIPALLAAALIPMLGFATISEAQEMKADQALTARQQSIVPIAAFTARGDLDRLKTALAEGLDAGLALSEIKEILVQMYAYTGFPRSLNALGAFMGVMEEREKKGIKDEPGREPSPLPANTSRLELGTEIQTRLSGAPVRGKVFTFAPAIDAFLKDHLFGDIFGRDNLDFQSREIATISALAAMEGVNPQLQAHFSIGMNVGLGETQLRGLAAVLGARVGKPVEDNANEILGRVLRGRAG
jgi:alkylhydroperoxidase/carboxymuconolactone decarboxylase family protein YurZ